MYVTTGCGQQLTLPASAESAAEICGLNRIKATPTGDGVAHVAAACAGCSFADREVTVSDGEAPPRPAPKPNVPPPSPSSPFELDTGTPGIEPVPSGLQLEPLAVYGEAREQDTPPLVDRAKPVDALDESDGFDDSAPPPIVVAPPPFEKVLAAGCKWWSAGGSLMGFSKLKTAKHCLRMFFYEVVLNIRRKPQDKLYQEERDPEKIAPLELGSLVHACLERFYSVGDIAGAYEPIEAVKALYPQLALEARRLINFYMDRFNEDEVTKWDMRAVERESRYYFPPRKIQGKRRSCCITARLDGCFRERRHGEPCLPPGARAEDNLRIHEIKTARSIGGSRIRGFYMKAQLLQNLLTFNFGHAVSKQGDVLLPSLADILGPCWAITVSHIGKNKRQDKNLDISRHTFDIPEERVREYATEMEDWYYDDIVDRLFSEHVNDARTWRRDWLCEDQLWPNWTCPYIPLCETNAVDVSVMFDKRDPLDIPALERPKKLEKLIAAKKDAVAKAEAK